MNIKRVERDAERTGDGMLMIPIMAKIMARILLSKDFDGLTSAQRAAVIEAIALTVVRSGMIADAARRHLRLDLLELPWAWEADHGTVDGLVDRQSVHLSRLEDTRLIGQLGASLARELDARGLKEKVYRLMVALAFADGGADPDIETLEPIRMAFEVRAGRALEIRDELKEELVAMVA